MVSTQPELPVRCCTIQAMAIGTKSDIKNPASASRYKTVMQKPVNRLRRQIFVKYALHLSPVSRRSSLFRPKPTSTGFFPGRCAILEPEIDSSQRMTPAMPSGSSSRSAMEIELTKLSSPRIFLVRMLVFLVLCALVTVVLYKQIITAFFANPGLNALIGAVLLIGIILSFRQVIRLYPEVSWVNNFRIADPGLAIDRRRALGTNDDLAADHAASARLHRHPARRGPRHFPLHDRPVGVSRAARHLLGPDRNRRLGRQGARRPEGGQRRPRA